MKKIFLLLFVIVSIMTTNSTFAQEKSKSGLVGFFPQHKVYGKNLANQEIVNYLQTGKKPVGIGFMVKGVFPQANAIWQLKEALRTEFFEATGITFTDEQLYAAVMEMEDVLFTGKAIFAGLVVKNGVYIGGFDWNSVARGPYLNGKERLAVHRKTGVVMSRVCLNPMKTIKKVVEQTEPLNPVDPPKPPVTPPAPKQNPPTVINCPPKVIDCPNRNGNGATQGPPTINGQPVQTAPQNQQPQYDQRFAPQQPNQMVPAQPGYSQQSAQQPQTQEIDVKQKRSGGEKFLDVVVGGLSLAKGGLDLYNGVQATRGKANTSFVGGNNNYQYQQRGVFVD